MGRILQLRALLVSASVVGSLPEGLKICHFLARGCEV